MGIRRRGVFGVECWFWTEEGGRGQCALILGGCVSANVFRIPSILVVNHAEFGEHDFCPRQTMDPPRTRARCPLNSEILALSLLR